MLNYELRKLIRVNGEETTVPDTTMTEIHNFYSELYDEKSGLQTDYLTCPFLEDTLSSPKLTDSMRETCDGQFSGNLKHGSPLNMTYFCFKEMFLLDFSEFCRIQSNQYP